MVDHDDPAAYGDAFADVYDDWYQDISDVEGSVDAIAALAAGDVLELGVGTGRLAIPLAAVTDRVVGIDGSTAMLAQLRSKRGGNRVHTVMADMAAIPFRRSFSVAFVAFNTFFNLTTEGAQTSCVRGVADALLPGGRFVVEAFVPSPEPAEVEAGSTSRPDGAGGTVATRTVRDPADQTVTGVSIHTAADGHVTERPWRIRYLHPPQLDAMCAARGLVLEHRWGSFAGDPFDPAGDRHVSCYRRDDSRLG